MTFPASGLFVPTMRDAYGTTQLALDLDLDTHKLALWLDAVASPNLITDTAYGVAPWNANQSTGTGYTAGGTVLPGTTWLHTATGIVKWTATDWSLATVSVTARGCLIYADALAGDNGIAAVNFGADYTSTAGTFLVQWAAGGIASIDFLPGV